MMNSGVDIGLPVYCALPTIGRSTLGCLSEEDTVHHKPNAFLVPNGSVGRKFIRQLSEYLACFGNTGSYQGQPLKIASNFSFRSHIAPKYHHFPNVCKEGWIYGNRVISNNCCMKVGLFKINYRAIIGVIPPQSLTLLGNLPVR